LLGADGGAVVPAAWFTVADTPPMLIDAERELVPVFASTV